MVTDKSYLLIISIYIVLVKGLQFQTIMAVPSLSVQYSMVESLYKKIMSILSFNNNHLEFPIISSIE